MGAKQSQLAPNHAKIQATITGIHAAKYNDQNHTKRMRAGIFWDDDDLLSLCLDANCLPLDCAPDDEVV